MVTSDEDKDLAESILALPGPERYWKHPGANIPDTVSGETLGESSTGGDPIDIDDDVAILSVEKVVLSRTVVPRFDDLLPCMKRRKVNFESALDRLDSEEVGASDTRAPLMLVTPSEENTSLVSESLARKAGEIKLGDGLVLYLEPSMFQVEKYILPTTDGACKKDLGEASDAAFLQAIKVLQSMVIVKQKVGALKEETRAENDTLIQQLEDARRLAKENSDRAAMLEGELAAERIRSAKLLEEGQQVANKATMKTSLELLRRIKNGEELDLDDLIAGCYTWLKEIGEDH